MIMAMLAALVDLMAERVLGLVALVLLRSSIVIPCTGLEGLNVLLSTRFNPRMNWVAASWVYHPLMHARLSFFNFGGDVSLGSRSCGVGCVDHG